MLWTSSTKEAIVSLKDDTPIPHIDLAELAEQARASSRRELANLIERHQKTLVEELCGPRYIRGPNYRRGGSYTKRLVTHLGEIAFKAKPAINRTDGSVRSPILEALDARRRRYSRGVRMRPVEFASKMSYGDARREYETATGIHVPKRTIHRFVQETAPQLLEASRMAAEAGPVIENPITPTGVMVIKVSTARVGPKFKSSHPLGLPSEPLCVVYGVSGSAWRGLWHPSLPSAAWGSP